jgi:hypothetical protein
MITRTGRRTVQGFNVQLVANANQIVLAAEVAQSINDGDQLEPMVDCAISELARAGIEEPISAVLADGGYWNSTQIAATRARHIDVLVPAKNRRRTQPRKNAPPQGDEARRMEAILHTPERTSALPTPTADRRTRLREHQIPPPHRPLPTTRLTRLPSRVEADRRHPQPPQTLARNPDPGSRLTPAPEHLENRAPRRDKGRDRSHHPHDHTREGFVQQPLCSRIELVYATRSAAGHGETEITVCSCR